MIKAVLFDLDGTLLNTLEDITRCVNETLRAFSYPELTQTQVRAYVGDGAKKLIERALPQGADNLAECCDYFCDRFTGANEDTKLYAGEAEVLQRLLSRGVKLAVVTNKPQAAAEAVLKKYLPQIEFSFIGGDSGAFPRKPDPSLAYYAALTMRVGLSECAFVGDGEADVLTARNCGIPCVACLWGYRSREQLQRAGATLFASDYKELEKILEDL